MAFHVEPRCRGHPLRYPLLSFEVLNPPDSVGGLIFLVVQSNYFYFFRIERKLRAHQYRDHNEFAADMRQMFTETYKYNNPESSMVTNAGKLQKEFELRSVRILAVFLKLCSELPLTIPCV